MLAKAVSEFDGQGMGGRVNWVKVTEAMGGTRSAQQCNQRWHATLKPRVEGGIKFGQWSAEEVQFIIYLKTHYNTLLIHMGWLQDEMLKNAVSEFQGPNGNVIDWIKVSERLKGVRSSHQCNHRWHGFLKPKLHGNLKQGPWSEEEVSHFNAA